MWPIRTDLMKIAGLLAISLFLVTLLSGPALAHKVYLFAWVEGNQVMVDAYFSKSRKVKGGRIKVLDPEDRELLAGTTDDQGAFSFEIPQKTDLRLVMEAGMGHQTEIVIKADELPDTAPSVLPVRETVSSSAPPPAAKPEAAEKKEISTSPPVEKAQIDSQFVKEIVEAALDRRLEPIDQSLKTLQRSVARLGEDRGPGLTEILGGLGWIMGLFGVAMYFRGRSKEGRGD